MKVVMVKNALGERMMVSDSPVFSAEEAIEALMSSDTTYEIRHAYNNTFDIFKTIDDEEDRIGTIEIKGLKAIINIEGYSEYVIFQNGMIRHETDKWRTRIINEGASVETNIHKTEIYEHIKYYKNAPEELYYIYRNVVEMLDS